MDCIRHGGVGALDARVSSLDPVSPPSNRKGPSKGVASYSSSAKVAPFALSLQQLARLVCSLSRLVLVPLLSCGAGPLPGP